MIKRIQQTITKKKEKEIRKGKENSRDFLETVYCIEIIKYMYTQ